MERAYVFKRMGDKLTFVMKPQVKVINPVSRIENWRSSTVNVSLDDNVLGDAEYRWQLSRGNFIIWLDREIEEGTEFEVVP
ncbi:MAG: hypothetical protein ACE5NN_06505 [Candidatus Bathyarchaeia archaeon]